MGWNKYTGPGAFSPGLAPATAATQQVAAVMSSLASQVDTFTSSATATINQLGNITLDDPGEVPKVAIDRNTVATNWGAPKTVSLGDLGDLTSEIPAAPANAAPTVSYTPSTPEFKASVAGLNIPNAPAALDVGGMPSRPDVGTVALPDPLTLTLPTAPEQLMVSLPKFDFPVLSRFEEIAPTFDGVAPSTMIDWDEPTYMSENFDEVKATIHRIFAGGTGLPAGIEQQMFDRARGREDITARKAVAEAFDTFANRGFTMPPGMLAEQVNAAQQQNQLQANALQRELVVKVAEIEIENMKFAVQQGLAAENIMTNLFMNAATRSFEVAKFSVESALQLYNTQVAVFNATMNGFQIRAQVHEINIKSELAALDAYRIELEGQKLIGEINTQQVQAYQARVQAVMSQAEIYKAQMTGAQVQAQVIATQIEAYRTDVQAYGEKIGAQKVAFDAYKTQVEGEVAKAGILDVDARVFSSLVQAEAIKADTYYKGVDANIAVFRANNEQYAMQIDRSKAVIQAALAKVEAKARVDALNIQYMTAQSEADRAHVEADIRIAEQQLQTNIALTQAAIKQYEVLVTKSVQEAELKSRALQAAGQMASTLAGGAMAAQHVSASIGASASDNQQTSFGFSQSAQENWTYASTST